VLHNSTQRYVTLRADTHSVHNVQSTPHSTWQAVAQYAVQRLADGLSNCLPYVALLLLRLH
jgi:hypothetical protein